jgi:FtsP/CotA-like multicopper oxidase with cupredoxin domain
LFWYHPHVQSATQVGFGLSGPLLVSDPSENVGVDDELVIVLNDIEIDENGALAAPDTGGTAGMAFGREGNIVLVNGKRNGTISARAGAPQRWRIVNTAKSRYFNLHVRGSGEIFTKIGGDGGLQEYPTKDETLVLAPGERADVIVDLSGKPGVELQLISELFNRGYGSVEYREAENLFRIALADLPAYKAEPLPTIRRDIQPLQSQGATPVSLELDIVMNSNRENEFRINRRPYWKAKPILAKIGETQLWTVNNTTPWSHPMHLHGFFFQVLGKDGQPVRPLQWKDTVDVPFKQSVQLLVRFDDRPGNWMVHCHILDHAEGGLMTTVLLGDTPAKTHTHTHRPE